MKLAALVLLTSVACSKSEKEAPGPVEPAKPVATAPSKPAEPAEPADPAAREPGQYKMQMPARTKTTGFARFDDAVAGKAPWLDDAELAAGIVEHVDIDSKPSQKRLCKDDAKAAVDKYAAIIVKRIDDTDYKSPACVVSNAEGDEMMCIPGRGPGETKVLFDYRKSGDAWKLVAVQYTDGDSNFRPLANKYEALIKTPCK